MSQPLWYLRHEGRIVGPFPVPRLRELLRDDEICLDWEISLDGVDWLSIADSGQFGSDSSRGDSKEDPGTEQWREQREQARQRWLQDTNGLAHTDAHDLSEERRTLHALANDQVETDLLLRQAQSSRTPVWVGLIALLALAGAGLGIWWGQRGESGIQTEIGLVANCNLPLAEAVNWNRCDKRGLNAPRAVARNTRMERINLEAANLVAADLSYAALRMANLRNANLGGIKLTGADLTDADLSGSDLSQADLRYVVLQGARLDGVRLNGAALDKAIWPDGRQCAPGSLGACL